MEPLLLATGGLRSVCDPPMHGHGLLMGGRGGGRCDAVPIRGLWTHQCPVSPFHSSFLRV